MRARRIRGSRRSGGVAVWALACAIGLAGATGAEPVGFVAAAHGDVRVDPGARGSWKAATQDMQVEIGDRVRTELDASAKIVLSDDTLLQLDEDTTITIESFHVGSAATRETSILRQTRGRLRTTVGEAFGGSTKLEVHTPTAAVGVKGTDFETADATETEPRWSACLISGGIQVANSFGAASPPPGSCVYAWSDRAPGDPFPNPNAPLNVPDGDTGYAKDDFEEDPSRQVGAGDDGGPEYPDNGRNLEDLLTDLPTGEPDPDLELGPEPEPEDEPDDLYDDCQEC